MPDDRPEAEPEQAGQAEAGSGEHDRPQDAWLAEGGRGDAVAQGHAAREEGQECRCLAGDQRHRADDRGPWPPGPWAGAAAKVALMVPEAYSLVMASTPATPVSSTPMSMPVSV